MAQMKPKPIWRPSRFEVRVSEIARRTAERQAARIPWPRLLKARELYVKWQAFLLWVRAIEEAEGETPKRIAEIVNKRCPGLHRFAERHDANDRRTSFALWYHLEQWINERIFTKPRREGWMDAVGYYAVRDLAALRAEAYWYYCDRQWKLSRPAAYPSFREWRKASEHCSGQVLDTFETTEELRELLKLSRRVGPRTLRKTVDQYVEWQVFAYWARAAFDWKQPLPEIVKRELRRRCQGFLATDTSPRRGSQKQECGEAFNLLLRWIEEHEFARAGREGWLPVLLYQAHLHPRHARVIDYWRYWEKVHAKRGRSRYLSLEQWQAAVDSYTFDSEEARAM